MAEVEDNAKGEERAFGMATGECDFIVRDVSKLPHLVGDYTILLVLSLSFLFFFLLSLLPFFPLQINFERRLFGVRAYLKKSPRLWRDPEPLGNIVGHKWVLHVYPGGKDRGSSAFSIFVGLADDEEEDVEEEENEELRRRHLVPRLPGDGDGGLPQSPTT